MSELAERIALAIESSIDNPIIRNGITDYTEGVRDATAAAAKIARTFPDPGADETHADAADEWARDLAGNDDVRWER